MEMTLAAFAFRITKCEKTGTILDFLVKETRDDEKIK